MTRNKALLRLTTSYIQSGFNLVDLNRLDEALRKYEEVISLGEMLGTEDSQNAIATAYNNKIVILRMQQKYDDAISICDVVIKKWEHSDSRILKNAVARTLFGKGAILADHKNELTLAVPEFEQAARVFDELGNKKRRGDALIRQAYTISLQNKLGESDAIYMAMRREYDSLITDCPEQIANLWLNQAFDLSQRNMRGEAIKLLRQLISNFLPPLKASEFDENEVSRIREIIVNAWIQLSVELAEHGCESESIAESESLIAAFDNDKDATISGVIAKAKFNQAVSYGRQGLVEKETGLYEKIVKDYDEIESESIKKVVSTAYINLAVRYAGRGDANQALIITNSIWEKYKNSSNDYLQSEAYRALSLKTSVVVQNGEDESDKIASRIYLINHAENLVKYGYEIALAIAFDEMTKIELGKGEVEKAISYMDKTIDICKNSENEEVQDFVWKSVQSKVRTFQIRKDFEGEKKCLEIALEIFKDKNTDRAYQVSLWAYSTLGTLLSSTGVNNEDALEIFRQGVKYSASVPTSAYNYFKEEMEEGIRMIESNSES